MQWDLNGSQGAAFTGMTTEQWEATRPPLTRENELVLRVWNFCGGWKPEALPLAVAYYDAPDADFLVSQLLTLKACVDEHEEVRRKAIEAAGRR